MPTLDRFLIPLVTESGSDLHLSAGRPPFMRIHGTLAPVPGEPLLTSMRILELLREIMPTQNIEELEREWDTDCAYEIPGTARFRVNGFRDMHGFGAVMRVIPELIPTFEELNLPEVLRDFCRLSKGLVIVTGPTGSGKSTTLSAMVDYINRERNEHIITIEDPIEFVHRHKQCLVNQREVYSDTASFASALRVALRQDPDVVLLGEMRDRETAEIGLQIAETGHLTFATLHTNSAPQTISRIIDMFQQGERDSVRAQLAFVLEGVVCQQLIPKIGGGRVCATEIMSVTPAIRSLIRDDKLHQLQGTMEVSQKYGMQTLNMDLAKLVIQRKITREDAMIYSGDNEQLEKFITGNFRL